MRHLILIAALLGATSLRAEPAPETGLAGLQPLVDTPNVTFTKFARGEDRLQSYPRPAMENGIQGQAWIDCVVGPKGKLHDCSVEAEAPPGQGFGEATVKLVQRKFEVAMVGKDGTPLLGRKVRVRLSWKLAR